MTKPAAAPRFLQMAVYIASALGLLVTTSLLGLRRYLPAAQGEDPDRPRRRMARARRGAHRRVPRDRRVPAATAFRGAVVRHRASGQIGSRRIEICPFARMGPARAMERRGTSPRPATAPPAARAANRAAARKARREAAGRARSGKGGSGKKGDQSGGNEKGGGKGKGDESESKRDEESADRQGGGEQDENQEPKGDNGRSSGSQSARSSAVRWRRSPACVKWIVFAIVAVAVVLAVVLGILQLPGPVHRLGPAPARCHSRLVGRPIRPRRKPRDAEESRRQPCAGLQRPPPFSEYSNPFVDGTAERRDPAELIAYTFEALDAWAWDRDAAAAIRPKRRWNSPGSAGRATSRITSRRSLQLAKLYRLAYPPPAAEAPRRHSRRPGSNALGMRIGARRARVEV